MTNTLSNKSSLDEMAENNLAPPDLSYLPDAETDGHEDWESDSDTSTLGHQESSDQPYFSDADDSEYHESHSNTPVPGDREVSEESYLSGSGDVDYHGNFDSDSNASTPGNHHVIDQYSSLSDAESNPDASTPDHQRMIDQSLLPDASEISDTTIKM